jgi:hypothetical protein
MRHIICIYMERQHGVQISVQLSFMYMVRANAQYEGLVIVILCIVRCRQYSVQLSYMHTVVNKRCRGHIYTNTVVQGVLVLALTVAISTSNTSSNSVSVSVYSKSHSLVVAVVYTAESSNTGFIA